MTVSTTSGTAVVTTPSDTTIQITRTFNAPSRLVFKALTTPELIKRWWSGNHGEVTVAEVDLRVGGTWRYVLVADGGFEVGFHGEYREIVPAARLVNTEIYEGMPDGDSDPAIVTYTFDETDGSTFLTVLVEHSSKEARDGHLNSGMEGGMQQSYDALEQVAVSLM